MPTNLINPASRISDVACLFIDTENSFSGCLIMFRKGSLKSKISSE